MNDGVRADRHAPLKRLLALCVFAVASVAALALIYASLLGATHTAVVHGPFAPEATAGSKLLSIPAPTSLLARPQSDDMDHPNASDLRMWINGAEIPAHTLHATIRQGGPGFSHWLNSIYFALPTGVENTAATDVRLSYSARPPIVLVFASAALALVLGVFLFGRRVRVAPVPGKTDAPREQVDMEALGRLGGNVLLALMALSLAAVLVAGEGVFQQTRYLGGPFANEAGTKLYAVTVPIDRPFPCCTVVTGDAAGRETASTLRLRVNDLEITPAHTAHESIRQGAPGFSHWGEAVYFGLPEGIPNTAATRLQFTYAVRPSLVTTLGVAFLFTLTALLLHWRRFVAVLTDRIALMRLVARAPYWVLAAIGWILAAAAVVYVLIVLIGTLTGDPLAPSIPFRSDFGATLATRYDSSLPLSLLLLCAAAAIIGWVGARMSPRVKRAAKREEISTLRWMRRYGLAVIVTFFIASAGATWAGLFLTGSTSTIAGLVPFFDAGGYFADVHTFLRDGAWSEFSSRRPLAAVARTVLFLGSDLRYDTVVLVQAVLLGGAAYFASMSVMRWRGVWAGVAFLALLYILVRVQITTTMTEPLGLVAAISSVPFFVEALRNKSRVHALLGVVLMCAAIWMRPGAMLTIPALALWFGLFCGTTLWSKVKHFAVACAAILAILAFDVVLGKLFASFSPGNFGYTLCGLSLGGAWDTCLVRYADELSRIDMSENAQAMSAWLYARALQNIQHDPGPLLSLIVAEPLRFLRELPVIMLRGYSNVSVPSDFPATLWYATLGLLTLLSLRARDLKVEGLWWLLIFASIIGSSTIFYYSDGVRTFSIVYVLIALFIALSFATPSAPRPSSANMARAEARVGKWSIAAVIAILLVAPFLGRLIYPAPRLAMLTNEGNAETAIVGGAARATGILVVKDGDVLSHAAPTLPFGRFADFVRRTGVEASQGLVTPEAPALPFGFMSAPRYDRGGTLTLIVPPEMLTDRSMPAWKVRYVDYEPTGRLYSRNWSLVISAEPLDATALARLPRRPDRTTSGADR